MTAELFILGGVGLFGFLAWRFGRPAEKVDYDHQDATETETQSYSRVTNGGRVSSPGRVEAAPDDELIGSVVGSYRIDEYIGMGGMAVVYKATKEGTDESAAIKLIRAEISQDQQFRLRFEREINICQRLEHANIMKLVEWGEHADQLFLALEYIEGEDLIQKILPQGMDPVKAAGIVVQLIDGLNCAHELGIVHRDLKPDNIRIDSHGIAKIMDFGLARAEDVDKITKTGQSMGTPGYLPPEQIKGDDPTPASDQYALGIIFYELLTGRRPFNKKNPLGLIMQQVSEIPANPLSHRADINPTLAAVVLRMLEKSPQSRFSSLQVIREGLTALSNGKPWSLPEQVMEIQSAKADSAKLEVVNTTDGDDDDTMAFQVDS